MLNKNISVEVVTFDIISSIFISVSVRTFSPVYRTTIGPLSLRGTSAKIEHGIVLPVQPPWQCLNELTKNAMLG
jgi:hypothetical protein